MRSRSKYKRDASFLPLSTHERIFLKRLCDVAKRLDSRLAIPATSSNFSLRTSAENFLISRSGIHKRLLTPEHFIRTDLDGKPLHPLSPKPSDETLLHALIYKKDRAAQAILHCHAPELEKLQSPQWIFQGHELLKAMGLKSHEEPYAFPVFSNSQDMNVLAEQIDKHSAVHGWLGCFHLERHGIYISGITIENALMKLEALLHLAHFQEKSAVLKGTKK
jgi:methylthioribulose-1-phosphate dehydratase